MMNYQMPAWAEEAYKIFNNAQIIWKINIGEVLRHDAKVKIFNIIKYWKELDDWEVKGTKQLTCERFEDDIIRLNKILLGNIIFEGKKGDPSKLTEKVDSLIITLKAYCELVHEVSEYNDLHKSYLRQVFTPKWTMIPCLEEEDNKILQIISQDYPKTLMVETKNTYPDERKWKIVDTLEHSEQGKANQTQENIALETAKINYKIRSKAKEVATRLVDEGTDEKALIHYFMVHEPFNDDGIALSIKQYENRQKMKKLDENDNSRQPNMNEPEKHQKFKMKPKGFSAPDEFKGEEGVQASHWLESMKAWFRAAGEVDDQVKAEMLLSRISGKAAAWKGYMMLKSDLTWGKLCQEFNKRWVISHKNPKALFFSSKQEASETPEEFLSRLTTIAKVANFNVKGQHKDLLSETFVKGLIPELHNLIVVSNGDLESPDINKTINLLVALDQFSKLTQESNNRPGLNKNGPARPLNLNIQRENAVVICGGCQRPGHKEEACWRDIMCGYCKRLGHPERRCLRNNCQQCIQANLPFHRATDTCPLKEKRNNEKEKSHLNGQAQN